MSLVLSGEEVDHTLCQSCCASVDDEEVISGELDRGPAGSKVCEEGIGSDTSGRCGCRSC